MNLESFQRKQEELRKPAQVVKVTELGDEGKRSFLNSLLTGPRRFDASLLQREGKQADNEASVRLLSPPLCNYQCNYHEWTNVGFERAMSDPVAVHSCSWSLLSPRTIHFGGLLCLSAVYLVFFILHVNAEHLLLTDT